MTPLLWYQNLSYFSCPRDTIPDTPNLKEKKFILACIPDHGLLAPKQDSMLEGAGGGKEAHAIVAGKSREGR